MAFTTLRVADGDQTVQPDRGRNQPEAARQSRLVIHSRMTGLPEKSTLKIRKAFADQAVCLQQQLLVHT